MSSDSSLLPLPAETNCITETVPACGPVGLVRISAGEETLVSVSFRDPASLDGRIEVIIEDLDSGRHESRRLTLVGSGECFTAAFRPDKPGLYRLTFSYQRGRKFMRDRRPFSYIYADPSHLSDLRVYTMIPRILGPISSWYAEVDRAAAMGFNMIQLMPLSVMDASQSPYASSDLLNIEPSLLDPDSSLESFQELEKFADYLLEKKIRLGVDLVLNHTGTGNPLCFEHPGWYHEDPGESDGIKRAGWYEGEKWHKWKDLALLDYSPCVETERQELWTYMIAYALKWAAYADRTGGLVRLDNLHSSHKGFMRRLMQELRRNYPGLLVLGELFASDEELLHLGMEYRMSLVLATQWEHKFVPQLRDYLAYLHDRSGSIHFFMPVSSHDSGSPAQEYGDVRSTLARLAVSAFLGPGPYGIVQGVEYGTPEQVRFIGPEPLLLRTDDFDLSDDIRMINELSARYPQLNVPANCEFIDQGHEAILAALRTGSSDEGDLVVVANLDIHRTQYLFSSHKKFLNATVKKLGGSGKFYIEDNVLKVEIPSCQYLLLELSHA